MAACYCATDRIQAGLAELARARERWPERLSEICAAEAKAYISLGQFDAACTRLKTALCDTPSDHTALYTYISHFGGDDPSITQQLRTAIIDGKPSDLLYYSLGKIEHETGAFEAAYRAYQTANQMRNARIGDCITKEKQAFAKTKADFATLPDPLKTAPAGPSPIFILGLPRSGTTLMESILSRHTDVAPMGECEAFPKIYLQDLIYNKGPQAVVQTYLEKVFANTSRDTDYFTDKNPMNFRCIGQIVCAFPNARILHMRRDLRAVAWSIYTRPMPIPAYAFGHDPDDIAAYFALYLDIMAFWEKQLPGRIHHVDYEAVTHSPDLEIRNVLKALNLP